MFPEEPDKNDTLIGYIDPYFGVAIAYVISTWANFEYEIDEMIWHLAEIEPDIGACITGQFTSVAARFNSLISLARRHNKDEKILSKVNKLKDRALATADKRNRVAHDPWFSAYQSKSHYRLQKTSKGRLDFTYKMVTEEELKILREEVKKLTSDFRELKSKYLSLYL